MNMPYKTTIFSLTFAGILLFSASSFAETQSFQNLHNGNNFLSFHVLPEDASLESVWGDKEPWISQIIGAGEVAYRLPNDEWVGNLKTFTRTGAYWVFFNLPMEAVSPFSHDVEGTLSDPDVLFDLHPGLNWVSYPNIQNSAITGGIPDDVEILFTKIFGEGSASTQTGSGWVGSLQSFLPGYGYLLEVTEAIDDFHFTCNGCDNETDYTYGCTDSSAINFDASVDIGDNSCTYAVPEGWNPTPGAGQAFYILHDLRINGAPLQADDVVGAFSLGQNVGFGFPQGEFTTVPALSLGDGDPISFMIYDTSTGESHSVAPAVTLEWADSAVEVLGCLDESMDNFSDLATLSLDSCSEPCEPQDCSTLGAQCGLTEDGCGLALDCGACEDGLFCSADFQCQIECVPTTCEELGATCGAPENGCGLPLDCGTCEEFYECGLTDPFICDCAAPDCMPLEEDIVEEDATEEEDTTDMSCSFDCDGPACNYMCMDDMIYTCQSDTWELVEDCTETGLICDIIISGDGDEITGEALCVEVEDPDTTTPEEDVQEPVEDAQEPVEDVQESVEDVQESEEDTESAAPETEEDTTSPVENDASGEEEDEVVDAESEDGCGSCAVSPSQGGFPPRGGFFLLLFAGLAFFRARSRMQIQ